MSSYPLPQAFLEKLHHIIKTPQQYGETLEAFAAKSMPCIRINTLKCTKHDVIDVLMRNDILFKECPFYTHALILSDVTARQITTLPLYQAGGVYIQSLSSMIPPIVLDPLPHDAILDLTAAPGSKTSQLAMMMENQGSIIANDIDQKRIFKLKAVLKQLAVENTQTVCIPGQRIWETYPEYFDRVLLDAPCSMEGRFNTTDSDSYSHWSPKKVKELARLQKWLLRSAVSAAKVGGTIVYSTCTLSPEENEEVIDWLLQKEKDTVAIEEISLSITEKVNGLTLWNGNNLDASLSKTLRILPSSRMEGFYVAKLRKLRSNIRVKE